MKDVPTDINQYRGCIFTDVIIFGWISDENCINFHLLKQCAIFSSYISYVSKNFCNSILICVTIQNNIVFITFDINIDGKI